MWSASPYIRACRDAWPFCRYKQLVLLGCEIAEAAAPAVTVRSVGGGAPSGLVLRSKVVTPGGKRWVKALADRPEFWAPEFWVPPLVTSSLFWAPEFWDGALTGLEFGILPKLHDTLMPLLRYASAFLPAICRRIHACTAGPSPWAPW